jgi:hypothetical protein
VQTYPKNTRHSLAYYSQVLQVLLAGLTACQRQNAIAQTLNDAGIPAATGTRWTVESVKAVLKRLRQRQGPHYHALLQICFDGAMTPAQARPLLQTL